MQPVGTDGSFTEHLAETLNLNWARFSELWIAPARGRDVGMDTPPLKEPPTIEFLEELINLDYEPTPATEQVVIILKETGKLALTVWRHKRKIYSILLRARDICNYIVSLGGHPENQPPTTPEDMLRSSITEALQGYAEPSYV